ncbi:MAG: hypothetical protein FWD32_01830 [Firmicutes bacterium]|nr:hypothetical protein [Bacillota bacterium]
MNKVEVTQKEVDALSNSLRATGKDAKDLSDLSYQELKSNDKTLKELFMAAGIAAILGKPLKEIPGMKNCPNCPPEDWKTFENYVFNVFAKDKDNAAMLNEFVTAELDFSLQSDGADNENYFNSELLIKHYEKCYREIVARAKEIKPQLPNESMGSIVKKLTNTHKGLVSIHTLREQEKEKANTPEKSKK